MDAEVKKELEQIEGRLKIQLHSIVSESIAAGFKDLRNIITELFNKDVTYLEKQQEVFRKQHEEHYTEHKKVIMDITGMRASVSRDIEKRMKPLEDRVEVLEDKQIKVDAITETTEKIEVKKERKAELSYGKVGLIVLIASAIAGLIGYFI
jgi:hypothetical protein